MTSRIPLSTPALRVLVFRVGSLGDSVVSIPALYAVRRHYGPASHIVLLRDRSPRALATPADVLKGHSTVDDFLDYPTGLPRTRAALALMRLILHLRRMHFDACIYLAPARRPRMSVVRDRLFFRASGVRTLLGFHAFPAAELDPVDSQTGKPALVRQEAWFLLDRLRRDGIQTYEDGEDLPCGLEIRREEEERVRHWLQEAGWDGRGPAIGVAPGAKTPANRWPLERFAEVGRRLVESIGAFPLAIGGPAESAMSERLVGLWGAGASAAGVFAPRETAALIASCRVFIGLDTGPTHLASAVGTPCVGLYSCRDNPGRWHPLGRSSTVLRKDGSVTCAGCMGEDCPDGSYRCTSAITVDEVVTAALQAMRVVGSASGPHGTGALVP